MTTSRAGVVGYAIGFLLLPVLAGAQSATTGAIVGVVKDTTGAVLPGVTVEASSPALIEKVRSVVTDSGGQYKIVDLRPGTYSVTFALPGFRGVKREGIELTSAFTATVDVELAVGSVEETITVSGASPTVETQNILAQSVLNRQLLNSIPTSKSFTGLANLVPGMSTPGRAPDVGGSAGENFVALAIHGGRPGDQHMLIDGMHSNNLQAGGGGGGFTIFMNAASVQEVAMETNSMSAES